MFQMLRRLAFFANANSQNPNDVYKENKDQILAISVSCMTKSWSIHITGSKSTTKFSLSASKHCDFESTQSISVEARFKPVDDYTLDDVSECKMVGSLD